MKEQLKKGEKTIYEQQADILNTAFILYIAVLFILLLVLW